MSSRFSRSAAQILLAACAAVAGCDSEHVHWSFVSNPSGDDPWRDGGAVIVIRTSSDGGAATAGVERFVSASGLGRDGPVTVRLAVGAELAVLEHAAHIELRAVVLPEPVVLPRATLSRPSAGAILAELQSADGSGFAADFAGPVRVLCAADGSLVAVEHRSGARVYGEGPPRILPPGTSIAARHDGLVAQLPGGRVERLFARPSAAPAQQIRRPGQGRLEVLGPRGQVLARLPESSCTLHGGQQGLFLTAEFPHGVGDHPGPIALTCAAGNRFLLRVDG